MLENALWYYSIYISPVASLQKAPYLKNVCFFIQKHLTILGFNIIKVLIWQPD